MNDLLERAKKLDVNAHRKNGHVWGGYWPATRQLLNEGMTLTDIFSWMIDQGEDGGQTSLTEADKAKFIAAMSKRWKRDQREATS